MPSVSRQPLLYREEDLSATAETVPEAVPRILCLHGGGTAAAIFRRQCRSLIRAFAPYFRLVFADAPYLADAPGPDAAALAIVYPEARYGPFRRWLCTDSGSLDDFPKCCYDNKNNDSNVRAAAAIEKAMCEAMEADDKVGGRGAWVGLLGFSQGAKIAASVLFENQVRREAKPTLETRFAGVDWRFGILLAGRAPLVALGELTFLLDGLEKPSGDSHGRCGTPPSVGECTANQHRLGMPTVHVHGLADPGLFLHQALYANFTVCGTAGLVEWDGDHRVAIKSKDVQSIVQATLRAAKRAGVPIQHRY